MKALILSGGSSRGSFQVGTLKHLLYDLEIQYDIITGVSVGALNGALLSMFPKDQPKQSWKALYDIWKYIDDSKIKKDWFPFNILTGLWKDSIYNSQPLKDLVYNNLNLEQIRKAKRKIAVGAVCVEDGKYQSFTSDDDCFIDAVLASSAYPMGLEPITINNKKYSDGGIKHIIAVQEAIDLGATELDIIICSPKNTTSKFDDSNVITFGMRCFDLMTDQIIEADLKITELYNKLCSAGLETNKRYVKTKIIRPAQNLDIGALSFSNYDISTIIEQGYEEAKQQY